MKVFLDDERQTPEGWIGVRWPEEAIHLLQKYQVTDLSLDHDLGETGDKARTGYDVILWLEEQVVTNQFVPPENITVHSSNSGARPKMESGIDSIKRFHMRNRIVSCLI